MVGAEAAVDRPAPIRNWRERALQTLAFELGGMLIVAPIWHLATGASALDSVLLLACLSMAVMLWMALYNTVFDVVEARFTGIVASDRPHGRRVLHAVGLEATSALVTWPLIVAVTGLGWLEALVADFGLTLAYALYGYLFHLAFDRLRPVPQTAGGACVELPR